MRHSLLPSLTSLLLAAILATGCGPGQPGAKAASPAATYTATLSDGIDFTKPGYPQFIASVTGMSDHEPAYRWTNAYLAPSATFTFTAPLPKRFILEFEALPLGPNFNKPTTVRIGDTVERVILNSRSMRTYRVELSNPNGNNAIEMTPPEPTIPTTIDANTHDTRKLGIALKSLKIRSVISLELELIMGDAQSLAKFWYHRAERWVIDNALLMKAKVDRFLNQYLR